MFHRYLRDFVSPSAKVKYDLHVVEEVAGEIKEGFLFTESEKIPISGYLPRFVSSENYADSFGLQWNIFERTQIDSSNFSDLTSQRFYRGTGWAPGEIRGNKILEAGSGAGRFTEILLKAGAIVYSFDLSEAVEANYRNNRNKKLCLFQGDIYHIPLEEHSFDKVFCYGVLQHTPNPKKAFLSLVKYLKPGGQISVDCYLKDGSIRPWKSKYLWRPLTTKMNERRLLNIIKFYIPLWFPIDTFIKNIPLAGRYLGSIIPCWNCSGRIHGKQELLEWAIMDTFDARGAKYDKPQTIEDIQSWFHEARLKNIEVVKGSNGVVGNGTRT
jgi:SAM-dependent methyltransferase